VLSVSGKPVAITDQIRRANGTRCQHFALQIRRDSEQIFAPIKLGR